VKGLLRVHLPRAIGFILAIALMAFSFVQHGSAGTPFNTPKSCNYAQGATCTNTALNVPPMEYYGVLNSLRSPYFYNPDEPVTWISQSLASQPTVCSAPGTLGSLIPGQTRVDDGITDYLVYNASWTISVWSYSPTVTCDAGNAEGGNVAGSLVASCPTGYTFVYTTSPLTGPYCRLVTTDARPAKQAGGLSCPTGPSKSGGANAGSGCLPKGDPVDATNGNLHQEEIDYPGAGSNPLKFARYYNSLNGGTCPVTSGQGMYLGSGWTATYFQTLVPISITDSTTTYNSVYAYRPDGRVIAFNEYNGVYSPDGDVSDSLIQTSGGWSYQTADDTIETYSSSGQLLAVTPRGQYPITVHYAAGATVGDAPISVSDAFGHTLTFSYTVNGNDYNQLSSITDPAGHTISYTHDSYERLTKVTEADSTTRQYAYSSTCYLTSITDENSVAYLNWTYNSSNLPATSYEASTSVNEYQFTYSLSGSSPYVKVTDPLGTQRTNNVSLIWGTYRVKSSNEPCPGCGEDASRTYDASGNITSRTDYNGNVTNYVYNALINLETSRTEAYGTPQARTITTAWDSNWHQPDTITEPNRATVYAYDGAGNVLTKTITDTTVTPNVSRTWTYTYDSDERMLTAQDPRTDMISTTTYSYYTCTTGSQCGQLQTVTDPVGNVTTYNTYNAHGQPLTITDPNGVVTTLTYDNRLRLTSRQVGTETTSFSYYATGLLKQVSLPDSSYVLYTYDTSHRLTQITDGAGNYTSYTLDAMGNRTAVKTYDPSGTLHLTHTRSYNTLNEFFQDINAAGTSAVTTTYGYDSNANQTSIAAPLSRNTANAYDPLNRPTQITDPNSGNTYFTYDSEDDLTSVKDPRSLTTSYAYNGFGDLSSQVSPDTATTSNTYDSGGNLSTSTDARGAVSTYAYDAANRVTSIAYTLSGVTDQTIAFAYDSGTYGKGRLTSASDANHSLSWTYDFAGRVVGKGLTVGSTNLSVGYGYTNADRTALVTPSGQSIAYGFNSNHQIASVKVNGTTVISSVTYEPFGGINGWTWGDDTTVSRTFNGDGLIDQIVTAGVTLGYSFDNANRITGISDSSNSGLTWAYGYDPLDRLTSATTSAISDGWTYDANGNRLTQTGTTAITFNVSPTSNQLNATTGGLTRSYSYDAAGHTDSYGALSFTYNNRGRLETASADSTDYLYNALGQMYEKSGTLGTTLFMQDESGHLVGEYSGSGSLIEETIWLEDIPVATLRPNGSGGVNIYYVHSDHLNTPRKVAQPTTDTLAWRWDADPFGTAAPNQNPSGLGTFVYNLRFPGQYYMAEMGLNQNWNREYDSLTARYIESDPIGLDGGINTYSYARGNPVGNFDLSGLECASTTSLTYCTYPDGGPSFGVPVQPGYPDTLGPDSFLNALRYHKYTESVPLGTADPNCVMQQLIDNPTPGNPKPAIATGTRNNAAIFGQSNWVTSYLTTDLNNGNPVVVNITDANSFFSPGYVARTVSNGVVSTYGEGLAWSQSMPGPRTIGNWIYWKRQMQDIVKACTCGK
jgi:RHS repeat-associated protein